MTFAEHCGENSMVIDFWISCIKGSQPLLAGFLQIFSFLSTNLPQDSCHYRSSFKAGVTVDEVKDTAEKLISMVRSFQVCTIYYIYYSQFVLKLNIISVVCLLQVPVSSNSVFLAGYLYYDLCERLTSSGRLIEVIYIRFCFHIS